MAAPSATLYRFKVDLSDVDRGVYEALDFRVAQHPSESVPALLTRMIAYVLNYESGLEFSADLSTPDEPAIRLPGSHGKVALWVDIGNPSARRLHKASKASDRLRVYTYKDPENLKREVAGESIHRAEQVEIFSLEVPFLERLGSLLKRDNVWGLVHNEGELLVTIGDDTVMSTLKTHSLV